MLLHRCACAIKFLKGCVFLLAGIAWLATQQVIVLTPGVGHLYELREPLGILGVEEGKIERMFEQAAGYLEQAADPVDLSFPMNLDRLFEIACGLLVHALNLAFLYAQDS